jgi:hypothetical protein
MDNKQKKKYQKSVKNLQCLGPCYKAGLSVLHPLFLSKIRSHENKPFCPTEYHDVIDERSGKLLQIEYDECVGPTQDADASTTESLIIFQSGFSKDVFLSLYYNINSFEECLEWLSTNKFIPIETKARVVNAALNTYGDNLDYFDDVFVDFYISYMKEKMIKTIYKEIYKNIMVKDDKVIIVKNSSLNSLKYDDNMVERLNYIVEKYFNIVDAKKFLIKFLRSKKIVFDDYNDILYLISKNHIIYIKNDIDNS